MENKEEEKEKSVSKKIPNPVKPPKVKEEPKKKFALPYEKKSWKGVKDVFRCKTCDHFEDNEDDMKLHVLKHVPKEEREKIFERLTR